MDLFFCETIGQNLLYNYYWFIADLMRYCLINIIIFNNEYILYLLNTYLYMFYTYFSFRIF